MPINRAEIVRNLHAYGGKETVVEPAMVFIEPLLSRIEHGFYFDDVHIKNEDIRDAIRSAVDDEKVYSKRIRVSSDNGKIHFADEWYVGTTFASELRKHAYDGLRRNGWAPKPLHCFSPSLPLLIRQIFMNHVAARLEKTYPETPEAVTSAANLGHDTIVGVLECYFNLTALSQGERLRKRVKHVILLASGAIPLARIKNTEHGNWTVLAF